MPHFRHSFDDPLLGASRLTRPFAGTRGEGKHRNDKIDIGGWLHGWGSNATARRSATNQIDHDLFRTLTAENPKDRSVVLGIEHFSTAPRRLAKPTADADGVCQGAV
jgi:hypothetical protein